MTILTRLLLCSLPLLLCSSCESTPTAEELYGTSWLTVKALNTEEPADSLLVTALIFTSPTQMNIYTKTDDSFQLLDQVNYRIEDAQLIVQYKSTAKLDTTLISRRGDYLELLDPVSKRGKRYQQVDQLMSWQ